MNGLDVILDQLREAGVPEQSVQTVALALRPPRADFQVIEDEAFGVSALEVERLGIRTPYARPHTWETYRRLDSVEAFGHCSAAWVDWVEIARGILAAEGARLSKATPP